MKKIEDYTCGKKCWNDMSKQERLEMLTFISKSPKFNNITVSRFKSYYIEDYKVSIHQLELLLLEKRSE